VSAKGLGTSGRARTAGPVRWSLARWGLVSLGAWALVGCPGQRRPPPEARAAASPSATPVASAATPTPSLAPTPQTLPEQVAAWTRSAEELLASAETLTPADLPRLEALSDRGGLLGDAVIEAEQDDLYDGLEEVLTRLAELRVRLVEASPKAGR